MDIEENKPKSPAKRTGRSRLFRFGLRSLFVFTTLLALGLGYFNYKYFIVANAIKELQDTKCRISFYDSYSSEWEELNLKQLSAFEKWNHKRAGIEFDPRTIKSVICGDELTSLTLFQYFPNIRSIDCNRSFEERKVSLKPLASLSKLESLYLWAEQISDLEYLANLPKLSHLSIESGSLSDINPLGECAELKELEISSDNVSDISCLANLTELFYLGIHSPEVSDVSALSKLNNLTELSISGTNVDLSPIAKLPNLTELSIYDTNVSDLSPLAKLPNLEKLFFDHKKTVAPVPLFNANNRRGSVRAPGFLYLQYYDRQQ